ncbi:MAG: DUF4396 domain-containing protein [Bacteroidetes bacterium]|nr:DUF4396 domain-containing protein [Bacteroidota bacterium]
MPKMNTLHLISIVSIVTGIVCCCVIVADMVRGHRQQMAIMHVVYPVTALYAGPLALLLYFTIGRKDIKSKGPDGMHTSHAGHNMQHNKPFWQSVVTGTLHCGSGCTLGDMLAEVFLLVIPVEIWHSALAGAWTVDFLFAFLIGILFQYFAIKPMRKISANEALLAALKADTLSLIAWQVGMYGAMAICFFVIIGHRLPASDPLFWFAMQIAMIIGFLTAYPMNWLLIKKGIKEQM